MRLRWLIRCITIAIAQSAFIINAHANPAGGEVVAGSAVIQTPTAGTVQINQSSQKAVINWQSYNVGHNEQVNYHQPNSSSITLNRINPNNGVSQIYGSINANGQVWLVNPAGIWFGPNSHVNVSGLVATTADINNADFMAGRYNFVQSSDWNGAVINEGYITVMNHGLVALVGPGAVNKGQITANLGTVILASGQQFTIDFAGDSLVNFTISGSVAEAAKDQNGNSLKHAVENSGTIVANGGKIQMSASDASGVLDSAINMSGVAVANSVNVKNGEIILSADNGRVTVSGTVKTAGNRKNQTGGTIKILGDEVVLTANALIDASGRAGGGTVLIGGNAHGVGPEKNASYTYVGRNVNIYADAKVAGSGGRVVVWSNEGTQFYGKIFARGGSRSGDGGWVETSGKAFLIADGLVTASAAHGANGSWLLDPYNVTITATTTNGAFDGGDPNIYTPTANTATANVATINAALDAGTSVTITTGAGGAQAGTITVSSAITKSSGATTPTLTLNAASSIAINAAISFVSGGLDLVLNAGGAITQTAAITASTLTANAGANAITLTNAGNDFVGAVALSNTGANAVAIRDSNTLLLGTTNIGGAYTITTAGDITQSGVVTVAGVTSITAGAGSNITLNNAANNFATFGVTSGLNVTVNDTNGIIFGASTISGTLDSTVNGAMTQSGALVVTGAATLAAGAANNITLTTATNNFSTVSIGSGNAVSLRDAGAIDLGASTISGTFSLTTAGAVTQSGALSIAGATTITAGAGNNITLANVANDFNSVAVTTGLNVSLADANALALGTSTISGTLGVLTNGAITQTGALAITGVTTLEAGAANDITLATATNNFSTVSVTSGNNVSLRDAGTIILGTSTVATSLGVIAGGTMTQSGVITSPSLTAKTLGTNLAITLNTFSNEVNTLDLRSRNAGDTANSGGAIAYRDATGFNINNMIATTSTVTLTAGDAVTQSTGAGTGIFGSTLTVKTLNDTGAAITLTNSLNALTTIDLRVRNAADTTNASGAISYVDTDGYAVAAANTLNTVTLTAGGAMTQTGAMTGSDLTAKTLLDAGAAITFNIAAGNNFANVNLAARNGADTTNAAGAIAYRSVGGFNVTSIRTASTLSLQNNNTPTNSPITQSGAIVVGGVATLVGGATNDITLNNIANDFETVAITSGLNVGLTDANALILGASTVTGTLGVTTTGAITQSGALTITGVTTLAAGAANDITLATSTNNFSTVSITSGNNVSLRDSGAIILGTSTVTTSLGVIAAGAITQSGVITSPTLTAKTLGTNLAITLNTSINEVDAIDLRSRNSGDTANSGGAIAYRDATGFNINNMIATTSTVTLTAGGAVTQNTGAGTGIFGSTLNVKTLNDTGAAITLDNSLNALTTVDLRVRNALDNNNASAAINYTDTNGYAVAAANTLSTVTLTAGGAMTQTGAMTGSDLTAKTLLDAGAAITFNIAAGNNFANVNLAARNGADTANAAGAIAYRSLGGFNVTSIRTASTLSLQNNNTPTNVAMTQSGAIVAGVTTLIGGASNDITFNNSANDFSTVAITSGFNVEIADANALILGTSAVSGTLNVNLTGALTQSGAVTVADTTTLNVGAANDITLSNSSNNFSTVNILSGNNVTLRDVSGIILGASTANTSLNITAAGTITQSGVITAPTLIAKTLGTSLAITLNTFNNEASTVDFRSRNAGDSANSGGAIAYLDATGFNIANTIATTGTVTLTAGDAITQSSGAGTGIFGSTLTVKTLNDPGAAITLTNSLNALTTVDLRVRNALDTDNASAAISFTDTNGYAVAAANTLGVVTLTGGGAITQTGTMTGSELYVKTLLNAGAAITLNIAAGNAFNTVNLAARNLADTANAAGAIAYRSASGFDISGIQTTSTLSLQNNNTPTNSPMTQSGAIIAGVTTIIGGATNDIIFNNGSNDFNTVAITSGLNVGITEANVLILGASTVSGALNLTTNGAITQSAAVSVVGTTTIDAGSANNITLNNAANNFSTVIVSTGNNVSLRDANALVLGASNINGTLGVTTAGALTQSGALNVAGAATFTAGAGNNITLDNALNEFNSVGIVSGLNVLITDANALVLTASTVSGTLGVKTNGAITQTGAIAITGVTTLEAGAANDITLATATNNFSTVTITSGNNVSLRDSGAIILGASTANTSLGVIAGGAITQSGVITAPTLTAKTLGTNLAITLNTFANEVDAIDFRSRNAGDTANSGGAITYLDATGFNIADMIATTSTVTLTAGGAITQNSGAGTGIFGSTLTVKTLNNSGAAIMLANSLNALTTIDLRVRNVTDTANTSGAISYTDTNGYAVAAANTLSTVALTAGGAITQTGAMTGSALTAKTLLDAGAAITFNIAAGNNFASVNLAARNGADTTNAPGAIAYRSVGGFDVTGIGTTSTLSLQNNNTITNSPMTQSGSIEAGATTLIGGTTNDINFNDIANDFTSVAITSGLNVEIADANALILGASTVNGTFNVTTAGDITQSGTLTITGATTLSAGALNDITLLTATNNFSSVSIGSAMNVALRDTNALVLGSSVVNGTFALTTAGSVSQTGALTIADAATFTAGAANDITLDHAGNNFNSVGIVSGRNVSLNDINALSLAASTVSGNMTVTTGGALSQSGAVTVNGATGLSVTSVGGAVLNNAANQIGRFSVANSGSGNIELFTTIPLTINAFSQSGGGNVIFNVAGTLNIANGVNINSSNGTINITADDLNMNATAVLNSGSADTTVTARTGTAGIGLTGGTMSISNSELQRMTAANLTINGLDNVNLIVDGLSLTDTANVSGTVTIGSNALNSTVTFANNGSIFKSLNVNASNNIIVNATIGTTVGDLTMTGPIALNIPAITTAGAQTFNGNVLLGSDLNLTANGNITFAGMLDSAGSMRNLTLDSGSSGNIVFNGNVGSLMRLDNLTINNVANVTNVAAIKVNAFIQNAGNVTSLGATGLDATSTATFVATNVTGNVIVQGLTLDTQAANLTGSVNGYTGQQAINQIVLLNTILPGTHFFDGIDMVAGPAPPPPTPIIDVTFPSPALVFASYLSANGSTVTITQGLANALYEYNENPNHKVERGCLAVSLTIKICKFANLDT